MTNTEHHRLPRSARFGRSGREVGRPQRSPNARIEVDACLTMSGLRGSLWVLTLPEPGIGGRNDQRLRARHGSFAAAVRS